MEHKDRVVKNIEKANSKAYRQQVTTHKINHAVINDILNGLTDDEIRQLYSMGEKLTIKTGVSLWDVAKSLIGA